MTYISIKFYKWQVKLAIGVFIAFILMFIKWKGLKNKKYLIPMLLIAMTPYCRYLVLAQHSRNHAMFTFRSQIITIMILNQNINHYKQAKKLKLKILIVQLIKILI